MNKKLSIPITRQDQIKVTITKIEKVVRLTNGLGMPPHRTRLTLGVDNATIGDLLNPSIPLTKETAAEAYSRLLNELTTLLRPV